MTNNSRRKIGNNVKIDIINDIEIKKDEESGCI